MAHDMTPAEQYDLVYQVIREIAVRCDGAQSKDFVGFNGVDSKFGRRIASVPRDEWTPDVCLEAAHIVLKYREQGITYTGTDVATLSVVKDAQGNGTNYAGRNQARGYEKKAKAKANRKVIVVEGKLAVAWGSDPDFSTMLDAVKRIPGRDYVSYPVKANKVNASPELDAFIDAFDFTVTDEARKLLEAPRQAPPVHNEITLGVDGKIYIKTGLTAPGQPACDAVKALPGRGFDRASYSNYASPHPQVLAFAQTFGLNIAPDARKACEAAQAALEARQSTGLSETDVNTIMQDVSRCGKPQDLPPVFVAMFKEMMAR